MWSPGVVEAQIPAPPLAAISKKSVHCRPHGGRADAINRQLVEDTDKKIADLVGEQAHGLVSDPRSGVKEELGGIGPEGVVMQGATSVHRYEILY